MVESINIRLEDGTLLTMSMEQAKKLYQSLNLIFDGHTIPVVPSPWPWVPSPVVTEVPDDQPPRNVPIFRGGPHPQPSWLHDRSNRGYWVDCQSGHAGCHVEAN